MVDTPILVIIEDDHEVRTMLCAFLEQGYYRIATANEYSLGRAILQNTNADLLITDIALPGGSGESLAELAREKDIPVLLMSGKPEIIRRFEAESIRFLKKPFRLSELKQEIERLLPSMDRQETKTS